MTDEKFSRIRGKPCIRTSDWVGKPNRWNFIPLKLCKDKNHIEYYLGIYYDDISKPEYFNDDYKIYDTEDKLVIDITSSINKHSWVNSKLGKLYYD